MKIISDGSPFGTKILNDDGVEIHGVVSVDIHIDAKEARAKLTLFSSTEWQADGEYFVSDPKSGEPKRIKRIEFFDRSEFSATAQP